MEKIEEYRNDFGLYKIYREDSPIDLARYYEKLINSDFLIEKVEISEGVERDMQDRSGIYDFNTIVAYGPAFITSSANYESITVAFYGFYGSNRFMIDLAPASGEIVLLCENSNMELDELLK